MSDTATIARPVGGSELIARAEALLPLLRQHAPAAEAARRLTPEVDRALRDAGLYRLTMPVEFGGPDASLGEIMRVFETLATADASAAWITWVACGVPVMSAFLSEAGARELFAAPEACAVASFAAIGRAQAVEGGYRVSGRWPFASGIHHATSAGGFCAVFDGETQRQMPDGQPLLMVMLWPVDAGRVIDVWQTTGLRATGSNDIEVDDLFVPEHRAVDFTREPRPGLSPVHYLNDENAGNVTCAAMALGIAGRAVQAFRVLAPAKMLATGGTLAASPLGQLALARAVSQLSQARGHLYETVEMLWEEVVDGACDQESWLPRTALASVAAVDAAIDTVTTLYRAAGTSAIFSGTDFDRCLRDLFTLNAHRMVQRATILHHGDALFTAA